MKVTITELIFQTIQEQFGITQEEIESASLKREISDVRKYICAFLKDFYPRISFASIGYLIGNRTHSTVLTARKKHFELIKTDKEYKEGYEIFKTAINEKLILLT